LEGACGVTTEYRHTIRGGNGAAAIHTRRSNGTSDTYYLHKDHLGSPELITNAQGGEVVRLSFGAYGERRDGADWSGPPPGSDLIAIANTGRRGFTGHEHLDNVGLIHMNGRVYDPLIGRFLGADPIVVAGHSQGVHPYAYVWNNPLRYTDPSGYCPDVVGCYESGFAPTIGGGLWNLALNRSMFQEPRVPSASPPSAAFVPPAMVLSSEGRATFGAARSTTPAIVGIYRAVGMGHGAVGSVHISIMSMTANQSAEATEGGIIDFILSSPEAVALTFGEESWALAFWNVIVTSPVETVHEIKSGEYVGAIVKAGETIFKPLKIIDKLKKRARRPGEYTRSQREAAKKQNAETRNGQMACEKCGKPVENIPSKKGVPTPDNQAHVHHDPPIVEGGGRHSKPVVLCPPCHKKEHH
jgi:RHS repeat-associated protein